MTNKIKNFSLRDQVMQAIHNLFNGGDEVPPMNVKDVNVVGTKLLQRRFDGNVHRFDAVSAVHRHLMSITRHT